MKIPLKFIFRLILISLVLVQSSYAKSLWTCGCANERGMFADRIASRIGDIITISMNETTTQNNSLQTDITKKVSIVGAVTSWLFPNSSFGKHEGSYPSTNINVSNDDFQPKAAITNSSNLVATGSATIIDILPNGNLVFEGKREIYFSEQKQYMVLRGIVRPDDIAYNNIVDAKYVADAQLYIIGEGDLSASQKKGWLLKLKDFINPF